MKNWFKLSSDKSAGSYHGGEGERNSEISSTLSFPGQQQGTAIACTVDYTAKCYFGPQVSTWLPGVWKEIHRDISSETKQIVATHKLTKKPQPNQ